MYRCHLQFYLVGQECRAFEVIRETAPLEHFTHAFCESAGYDKELLEKADVILVNLNHMERQELMKMVSAERKKDAEIILLADKEQMMSAADAFSEIKDIWTMPMPDEELRFRIQRWQQTCKLRLDFFQVNQYLEATINSVPNLIWYKDKDGIHEKVNDSFCQTVNKTKKQVEGRGHAYIWDVECDDPACIESENVVMTTQKTCVSEETIMTGEGTRLLTTYKSPLYDYDGTVMGTVGVAIDVTQERAYEQEIIQKNHALEALFTTMDCGVISHSLDGSRLLNINRAALKILGYESQEELMEQGFDLIAPSVVEEDQAGLKENIKKLTKEGDSVSVEYRTKHKDGKILHVMGNVKLIMEEGELICQRFLLDCTIQKRREEKRRLDKERRQMELIKALSIDYSLVCFFDLETGLGNVLQVGEGSEDVGDIFKAEQGNAISLEESMGKYIQKYVCEEDRERMRQVSTRESLGRELSEKKLYYANYRVSVDGETKYYLMKVVHTGKWKDRRGIVLGLRSVDEETRNEMEKNSLLEDALLQANRANKAKSVFLSNMSHDIRTPMNAIVGFTDLALAHIEQTEKVEEYLKKITTSGNHLLSLINDILDMSRIESGKMQLDEKLCSLPEILHSLRNIIQGDIHAKQLELFMDAVDVVDEDIYCDRLRLNQVLLNLLGNALKFTPAGGVISIRLIEKTGAPEGYANYEFHVKDTGIGMSRDFVEHIFEPFEREKTSTISGIQGTGLGMAITKNIVDMMGGSITVISEKDEGTEFTVSLLFRLHTLEKESPQIPEWEGCRALVIDDDFNTCDSVSYMLQQIGLRAEWTLSGKEALLRTSQAISRGDHYGVYIVDWQLTDLDGIEVARRIRKKVGDDVPIIILSAYDWTDIEEEAKEAGITAFCSKPLFLSELRNCFLSLANTEAEDGNAAGQDAQKLRTGRILLVEDNELNQEIAEAILTDAGYSVEIAENGQTAVDMIQNSEPGYYQLVLMDVQMPVMGGYEATRIIRSFEKEELASIPIIAMTADAFEEDRKEAIKSGMNDHITKPIDIEKLFAALDKILA